MPLVALIDDHVLWVQTIIVLWAEGIDRAIDPPAVAADLGRSS